MLERRVEVEQKLKIKIADIEIEVTKKEAEDLYSALFAALNNSLLTTTPILVPWTIYEKPYDWTKPYIYCSSNDNSVSYASSDSISVDYVLSSSKE